MEDARRLDLPILQAVLRRPPTIRYVNLFAQLHFSLPSFGSSCDAQPLGDGKDKVLRKKSIKIQSCQLSIRHHHFSKLITPQKPPSTVKSVRYLQ
jgi:hypothetical protein